MPAFYNQPETIDDIINHSVGRVLDLFGLDAGILKRWEGPKGGSEKSSQETGRMRGAASQRTVVAK